MEFKVGDKVKVTTERPWHGLANVIPFQDVGEIKRIRTDVIEVDFPRYTKIYHRNWNGVPSDLALASASIDSNEEGLRFLNKGEIF